MTSLNKILAIVCLAILSCKASSKSEEEKQIDKTILEALNAVNNNDYLKIIHLDKSNLYKNDTSTIKHNVSYIYYIIKKYKNIKELKWTADSQLDHLHRIKYTIPLFIGFDSLTGIKKVNIYLYMGPSEIIPYDKLSGFETEIQLDSKYRRQLRLEGKQVMDIEDIVDIMDSK